MLQIKKGKNYLSLIFTTIIVLSPLLSLYQTPFIAALDFATFLLLLITPFLILNRSNAGEKDTKIKYRVLIVFLVYLFLTTMMNFAISGGLPNIVLFRLAKIIVMPSLFIVLFGKRFFDGAYAKKLIVTIGLFFSIYLLLQTFVFYVLKFRLPNLIKLNWLVSDLYLNVDYDEAAKTFYRPSSFFAEPAHFVQFTVIGLALTVFSKKTLSNFIYVFIFCAATIASTSLQGIVWAGLTIIVYLFRFVRKEGKFSVLGLASVMSIILLGFILSPVIIKIPILEKALMRIFDLEGQYGGSALLGRLAGFDLFVQLDAFHQIFGMGFGNTPVDEYFNSFSYALYCYGYIGGILQIVLYGWMLKHASGDCKYLAVIFIVSGVLSNNFNALSLVLFTNLLFENNFQPKTVQNKSDHMEDEQTVNQAHGAKRYL